MEAHARPAPLSIDLNEIPSPPCESPAPPPPLPPPPPEHVAPAVPPASLPRDAYALVCRFHGRLAPAPGPPAEFPGEAGVGHAPLPCGLCGRPETRGATVVCDGCERGFHLSCVGLRPRPQISNNWNCTECECSGGTKKRWALGAVRLPDINAPPPSDGGGEANQTDELRGGSDKHSRMSYQDGHSFGSLAAQFSRSIMSHRKNRFEGEKETGMMTGITRMSSDDVRHLGVGMNNVFEEPIFGSSERGTCKSMMVSLSDQLQGEMFLQYLRNCIMEKGGFLGEGWHVESKQYPNRSDPYFVYCSPDGKKFESMSDVAHYLGVKLSFSSVDNDERSDASALMQRPRRRKKDLTRISTTNSLAGNQDNVWRVYSRELSSENEVMEPQYFNVVNGSRVKESILKESGGCGSEKSVVGLPVQYEDFFVISLGKVDLRKAYHGATQIWPIGFKSSWHDRFTGSLFECEVSDGGDSGPVFKVRRSPCSVVPIPNGATVLVHNKNNRINTRENIENGSMVLDSCYDKDDDILMLLSDPTGSEQNLFSSFSKDLGATLYSSPVQMGMLNPCISTPHLICHPESSSESSNNKTSARDEIWEFYVEGRSSSSVWKIVSHTLVDACREVYKQSGRLQFLCKHNYGMISLCSDYGVRDLNSLSSLSRFCSAFGPMSTPRIIRCEKELEDSCMALEKWLDQDRFGLDLEFVQEIIENVLGSHACLQYQKLKDRSDFLTSWTVESGLLLAVQKNGELKEVVPDSLYGAQSKSVLQELVEGPQSVERGPPPGRSLSSKLPAELVGDVLQIWEFLWRFYEILGLKEPLSFEELEEELIDPWPCDSNHLEKFEKVVQCTDPTSLGTDGPNGPTLQPCCESDSTIDGEDRFICIPNETEFAREAVQAKLASCTYGRCTGIALRKVHTSLLKVLVSELQCKVAVFVDPNFDARELKSRRGRRRDMENSLPFKETKTDILIVNELTWPELARRYVLAVSSMNGRMDSLEVISREGVKVFRCLYGDGGVLCGSLTGVAGMEVDALLLAEAERQISNSIRWENEVLPVDNKDSDAIGVSEPASISGNSLPEWAQSLEPVRKLPTNVGTRIRKCIYDALAKDPPEWAKKILEHSISKEVYKGNASGPTKKAVLSVLAEACGGSLQHKPDKVRKTRKLDSIPDAVMKKCRIVLRSAVSADEAKVFCNLLGTTLLNPNDNEDEGILGLPAMVSRPLDFRTIDLRLAAGAYGGSHETFLEDVREVWHNIRAAYGDRPDLMQLAETLSQNFEGLYEKEVLNLVRMLNEHPNTEGLDAEAQKKLEDVLLGANDIPKAPWEDGVCKVCGIDKDDDSVLLCDTCDSEYHTYCLSPPLARIPEGDWYCPSCVAGQHKTHNVKQPTQQIDQHMRGNLAVESHTFQEALNQLATSMEEREYWEFTTEERIHLLKFLCDEVLSTALVREHLEQCAEKSIDLQQRLRALTMEWRNLKYKEELLAMRSGKENTTESSEVSDRVREGGASSVYVNDVKSIDQQHTFNNKVNSATNFPDNTLRSAPSDSEVIDSGTNSNDADALVKAPVIGSTMNPRKGAEVKEQDQIVFSSQKVSDEARGEVVCDVDQKSAHDKLDVKNVVNIESNSSMPSGELPPLQDCLLQGTQQFLHANVAESDVGNLEISSLKNEISQLQDSIANLESQLMTTSLRREFMGKDSSGRLYWVVGRSGKRPWLMVDGSMPVPSERGIGNEVTDLFSSGTGNSPSRHLVLSRNVDPSESDACNPYNGDLNDTMWTSSSWIAYKSDYEIQELLDWLRDTDPRERELKDCIFQWQRMGFSRENNHVPSGDQLTSESFFSEKFVAPNWLNTKASIILAEKHGSCLESEPGDNSKKRGRKTKISTEVRMYRCDCLEPVWPSRNHCLSCHVTFSTFNELEGHNDGRCIPTNPGIDESKETDDPLRGRGTRSEREKEHSDEAGTFETSKDGKLDISSKLVNFQRKSCPYDICEINRKFITTTSNKELVQEIGLLGSNGVPSFFPNALANFLDPSLVLHQSKKYNTDLNTGLTSSKERPPLITQRASGGPNACFDAGRNTTKSPQSCVVNSNDEWLPESTASMLYSSSAGEVISSVTTGKQQLRVDHPCKISEPSHSCMIPESSLKPLLGKNSQILKRLKINLLDMDAALPEEALRPSKVHLMRRSAWRAFVKSAESIFEVVQATILFEGMIKTEFLKSNWWYWSSLTAAAKTPTVSSLALRIYTLDDCIIYSKTSQPSLDPTESVKPAVKGGRKRKDMEVGS